MTTDEKQRVSELQHQGLGYKKISALTGISANTVKSYCKAHPCVDEAESKCLNCGVPIFQTPHRREKKFCSDKCRNAWWTAHPEMRKVDKPYKHVCLFCGKEFTSDRPGSRYCSTSCFADARRGVNRQ